MDEQTLQEQTQESSFEPNLEQTEPINDIPEDEPAVNSDNDGSEPEISLQDGEVKFSDDFFDDIPDDKASEFKEQGKPNYYTDEELQNIPANNWDKSRMPDDVKKYYDAFLAQQAAFSKQQEIQQRAETPPSFLTEPKRYTPKDLHEEAVKLAVQKLGLNNTDDFDIYEGEHLAALDMARQELLQKSTNEAADYQRKFSEYKNWTTFQAQLAGQSDFKDFHNWYLDEITKNGNTEEQINAGLVKLAESQGFGAVQQTWAQMYQIYKNSKTQNKPSIQRTRAKMPPRLESSQGGNSSNRRSYNMRDFANLDEDGQVQALMDMGIV